MEVVWSGNVQLVVGLIQKFGLVLSGASCAVRHCLSATRLPIVPRTYLRRCRGSPLQGCSVVRQWLTLWGIHVLLGPSLPLVPLLTWISITVALSESSFFELFSLTVFLRVRAWSTDVPFDSFNSCIWRIVSCSFSTVFIICSSCASSILRVP